MNDKRTTHNGPWREKGEDGKYLSDDSPWSADFDGRPAGGTTSYVPILDAGGTTVALVVAEGWDDGGMMENARLIAAAPDLLAAAKTVLDGLHRRIDAARDETPVFDGIAALHDAIASAESSS
jgi:hypothetical protein